MDNINNKVELAKVLHTFKYENKLSNKRLSLIVEAYRRFIYLNQDNTPIKQFFAGCGFPSEYKNAKDLFQCYGNEIPKCLSWYTLTPNGVTLVLNLISKTMNLKGYKSEELNTFLFEHPIKDIMSYSILTFDEVR
jgi:hypothetical protein